MARKLRTGEKILLSDIAKACGVDAILAEIAPDILAVLNEAQRMVGAYAMALERGGNTSDATHANYVERQIAETLDYFTGDRHLTTIAAMKAIVARVNGVWDAPELAAYGALGSTMDDVLRIAQSAITKATGAA